jgi:hypothetical protein
MAGSASVSKAGWLVISNERCPVNSTHWSLVRRVPPHDSFAVIRHFSASLQVPLVPVSDGTPWVRVR